MHTYPYRACIENLFSFGSDAKENQLESCQNFGTKMNLPSKFEDLSSMAISTARISAVETE